ncbi:MAG: hypothetical protein ACKOCH_28095, partial [Bacteroidota bacterium]
LSKDRELWSYCSENSKMLVSENFSAEESIKRLTNLIETCGTKSEPTFPVVMTPATVHFNLNSSALNVQYSNVQRTRRKYHPGALFGNLVNRITGAFSGGRI